MGMDNLAKEQSVPVTHLISLSEGLMGEGLESFG
jgi:hypothetical protein